MKIRTFALTALAAGIGGCTLAPTYNRPALPVADTWPTGPAYAASAQTNAPLPAWETFYPDAGLRRMMALALTNNCDLRLAALAVEQARALYGVQRASLFPSLTAEADGLRKRVPADLSSSGERRTTSDYSVNFGVFSWEPDFFGRLRSLKEEALHTYLATEEARRSTQILMISSVADASLSWVADRERLALAQTTLAAQEESYRLVKQRYDRGVVPALDLHRAQTQVDTARGDVALYTRLVAQDANALTLLTGGPLPEDALPQSLEHLAPPADIGAGLPSDVLLARPDVLAAEERLQAAQADIGAARAAFFPRISLTATAGTASSDLAQLFKNGQNTWTYAPQIALPIFDARTWSALRVSKAQQRIASTRYEQAIQAAFRETADALAARGTLGQQLAAQTSLVSAVSETYRLSVARYDKGIDSYLSVLDAQRSLYAAQQGLVTLKLAELASRVRLYAVLGGGR